MGLVGEDTVAGVDSGVVEENPKYRPGKLTAAPMTPSAVVVVASRLEEDCASSLLALALAGSDEADTSASDPNRTPLIVAKGP